MSVTGTAGGGPVRAGIAVSDTAAGSFLTQGVLAALYARERSGRGQWVHTSLLESMINFMDFQAARWLVDGIVPGQAGNDHPTIFPMGVFRTRDGQINIAVMAGWRRFCAAIDAAPLVDDPRFADCEARAKNREPLREAIEAKLVAKTSDEWIQILTGINIPCGPILSVDEVFADPQVEALRLTRKVEHATDGEVELLRHPVTLSETPTGIRTPPPIEGAHTREILREYGYQAAEIAELLDEQIVATARGAAV